MIDELTVVLILQRIPYVNRIVIATAKYKSAAQRQTARCKPGIRTRWFKGG